MPAIQFDKLYIIGPTGNQYEDLKYKVIVFIKDVKDLPRPDELPKDIKKLIIFDDVGGKEAGINEYFCRGRHSNCEMIYLKPNTSTADRQKVLANCNLFILIEQRGKDLMSIYHDFSNNVELSYIDFAKICIKVWEEDYNYIVIDKTKNKKKLW